MATSASAQPISLWGTYDGHSVALLLDPSTPYSRLSTSFVLARNIPRQISSTGVFSSISCACILSVPTCGGWFRSTDRMPVEYIRDYDIVLGSDWFGAVSPQFTAGVLVDPPPSYLLPPGFSWEASTETCDVRPLLLAS
ncbi:hypothetical protein C8Q76DRAFT_793114 [Earliella scabrosa]|nr:hypothetical protein C8Q76DRAFT_793114 [Earliella scabrosa]